MADKQPRRKKQPPEKKRLTEQQLVTFDEIFGVGFAEWYRERYDEQGNLKPGAEIPGLKSVNHCYTCRNEPTVLVDTYLVHNDELQSRRVWCQSCYDTEYGGFNDESHADVREIIYIKVAKLEIA